MYFFLPGERVEEPSSFGLRESHSHARHQGRVKNDSPNLIPRGQVNRGYGSNTLPVQDDVFR